MSAPTKLPTVMSSREFNQHTGRAKRATVNGPVIITDRGRETHVLMSAADYRKLKPRRSLLEALAHPESADYDFEVPERQIETINDPFGEDP